jgi:hypothetical protein
MPVSPTWLRLLVNTLFVVPTAPVHATWLTQLILLNFISLTVCEEYGS